MQEAATATTTTTVTTTTTTTTSTTVLPVDLAIFTSFATDETQDQSYFPDGGTYFDETDITRVACAVLGDNLYIYAEVVGTFEMEADYAVGGTAEVHVRSINIGVDLDNSTATGWAASGLDLHGTYGIWSTSSTETAYWGVYEFNEDDTHVIDRYDTVIHNGGLGYNYVVFSVSTSEVSYLGVSFVEGMDISFVCWGEADAGFKEDGTELYHDYAFDTFDRTGATLGGD